MSATSTTDQPIGSQEVLPRLRRQWDHDLADVVYDLAPTGPRLCAELELELRAAPKADQDQMLHALLLAAAEGDEIAEAIVLHHMLPKAVHLARSCAALRSHSPADAVATAIGAMWEAIRTYPLHRSSSVHGNLGLNALSIISRTLGAGHRKGSEEYPTSDEGLAAAMLLEGGVATLEPEWGDDSFRDLVTVLRWATDTGVLSCDEVRILARCDLGDDDERQALADQLGLTRQSLNRRVHRVRTKLIEAVQAHVRANGSW